VTGHIICVGVFLVSQGDGVSEASTAVDQMMSGHTVGERSWKDADFQCISCI
jgi:hypothetical protein